MPIFGQVWLWSLLAFLLGAVLCWLLVARPARTRVTELEDQLASRGRRTGAERQEPSRQRDDEAEFSRSLVPGIGTRDEDSEYVTRAYGLRATPPPLPPERERLSDAPDRPSDAPEPAREPFSFASSEPSSPPEHDTELADQPRAVATQYLDVSAGSLTAPPADPTPDDADRGWFDDELEGEEAEKAPEEQPAVPRNRHQLVEPDDVLAAADERPAIEDDNGGTVFTQRTHPIPGELIRQIDEAGKEENAAHQPDNLVDDLPDERPEPAAAADPDPAPPAPAPAFAEPEPSAPQPPPESPAEKTEIVSSAPPKPEPNPHQDYTRTAALLPRRVPQQSRINQGVSVRVEPTPSALPKRVPGKPRHQIPFGVEPTPTPDPTPTEAAAEAQEEPQRSLFEPIIPAADEGMATPPPPHRLRQGGSGGRGPFGPGSAMPLPGGASPSPEFTIKASVAALRYCTPESTQFGRTVAEVWFRTAADAERVGFRPVG